MRTTTRTTALALLMTGVLATGTTAAPAAERPPDQIRFARGASSGTVSGRLPEGGSQAYAFRARAGQSAGVTLSRGNDTLRWTLVAPDGSPLHTQMGEAVDATVRLPRSGDYRLTVLTRDAGRYRLTLTIPAASPRRSARPAGSSSPV